jgi:hypothetical protein
MASRGCPLSPDLVRRLQGLRALGYTVTQISRCLGISRVTCRKYLPKFVHSPQR